MLPTCLPSTPLQKLVLRSGLEVEESHRPGDSVEELSGGTGRQCRGAVREALGQCSGAVLHWGSSRGPDHRAHLHWWLTCNNYSNRIQSFARCLQPRQPSPLTPRNAPLGHWCSSTLEDFWRMGSSVMGRLTNVVVSLWNSWFGPAHFDLMSQERSGATSASTRGALL